MMSNFLSVMWKEKKRQRIKILEKKCLSNDATHATFILKSVRVFGYTFSFTFRIRLNVLLYQIDKK